MSLDGKNDRHVTLVIVVAVLIFMVSIAIDYFL